MRRVRAQCADLRRAYAATDEEGPQYSGIRYLSRLGNHECWAVFDGTALTELQRTAIVDEFGLRPF